MGLRDGTLFGIGGELEAEKCGSDDGSTLIPGPSRCASERHRVRSGAPRPLSSAGLLDSAHRNDLHSTAIVLTISELHDNANIALTRARLIKHRHDLHHPASLPSSAGNLPGEEFSSAAPAVTGFCIKSYKRSELVPLFERRSREANEAEST